MIWKNQLNIERINEINQNTLCQSLGITITEVGNDYIKATMPADHRTCQPHSILQRGASVALGESLGSIALQLMIETGEKGVPVGIEINANHLRPVSRGLVTGIASPLRLEKMTMFGILKYTMKIKN
ncbi:MAG TPA: hotdog fold thioesterase [Saprospiraceae bacterium]|nr:hotdog fold thioesterase [Saprospiraceae bacterium]